MLAFMKILRYNNVRAHEASFKQASGGHGKNALLAQLVEHLTLNQGVQGSSPWRRTKALSLMKCHWGRCFFVHTGAEKENAA